MRTRMRRRRRSQESELNVTTFMNLMVVLVPFLLMMAVFSRTTILELSLPAPKAAETPAPGLQLEVIVREDRLQVADRRHGILREIGNQEGAYDLITLSQTLQELKRAAPDTTSATLLLEPQVRYEQVVEVIDAVRVAYVTHEGERVKAELFPDVAVGDAPVAGEGG